MYRVRKGDDGMRGKPKERGPPGARKATPGKKKAKGRHEVHGEILITHQKKTIIVKGDQKGKKD